MLEHLIFALSAGLTWFLTNLDNLAVLFALLLPLGVGRAVFAYVVAQALVLGAVLSLAETTGSVLDGRVGFLGLIPICLGLVSIWRRPNVSEDEVIRHVQRGAAGLFMAIATFLTMSLDSFAVMLPLLAESAASFRTAAVVGAMATILLMAVGVLVVARAAAPMRELAGRAEVLGPYVMIAAGVYVLLDSVTDFV